MDEDCVKERKIMTAFKETVRDFDILEKRATDLLDQITMMEDLKGEITMRGKLTDDQMLERLARRKARKKASGLHITKTRIPTRKEMRSIAKVKLKLSGYVHLFKKRKDGKSAFRGIWREWAFKKVKFPKRRTA